LNVIDHIVVLLLKGGVEFYHNS